MSSLKSGVFDPLQSELRLLVRHWAEVAITIEFRWFLFQEFGSVDNRQRSFAWNRVAEIADLLGTAEADKEIQAVHEEMARKGNPEYWRVFFHGTPAERQAVRDAIQKMLEGNEEK